MRKLILSVCLAAGLVFAGFGVNEAKADHGFYGRGCGPGQVGGFQGGYGGYRGVYVAGYPAYGQYYVAPVAQFHPVGVYGVSRIGVSQVGVVPYGFGYNNISAARFGGAYGNLGYPNSIGPRSVLRIGF